MIVARILPSVFARASFNPPASHIRTAMYSNELILKTTGIDTWPQYMNTRVRGLGFASQEYKTKEVVFTAQKTRHLYERGLA